MCFELTRQLGGEIRREDAVFMMCAAAAGCSAAGVVEYSICHLVYQRRTARARAGCNKVKGKKSNVLSAIHICIP